MNNKLQTTAVCSLGLDLGMEVLKNMVGKSIDGELLKGHEKKLSIHLRSALDKKVKVQ